MNSWIDPASDPFDAFNDWFETAQTANVFEPTSMTLATLGENGFPSARVVLLKKYDQRGFCFFTNYHSRKGRELAKEGKAALVFHWQNPKHRQIRIQGSVEKTTYQESSAYFKTRHRGSQIGAWASPQSRQISGRSELEQKVKAAEGQFQGKDIPCPENWGGYRLTPLVMEFWEAGEHRLHDRIRFTRTQPDGRWTSVLLAP